MASLLQKGTSPNLIKVSFCLNNGAIILSRSPLQTGEPQQSKQYTLGCIIPLLIEIVDIFVRACFGAVEDFAVHAHLGTSFIDNCIRGIFPFERKVVTCHSGLMRILSCLLILSSILEDLHPQQKVRSSSVHSDLVSAFQTLTEGNAVELQNLGVLLL